MTEAVPTVAGLWFVWERKLRVSAGIFNSPWVEADGRKYLAAMMRSGAATDSASRASSA
jgi:hypothetical protein